MRTALVGCTGFVGGNIAASHAFDGLYHSTDVEKAFHAKPELLIYAGLPAAKYLANNDAEGDWRVCENAFSNIQKIAPEQLVLISTVDVYEAPCGVDENTPASLENPEAYGRNRARLEKLVREQYPDALIVRLPGLFGAGLKKNFIYDFLTITPAMLKEEKYTQLSAQSELVKNAYAPAQNGFYKLCAPSAALREWFAGNDFNALSFTDSRSVFQFYDLSRLWRDLSVALAARVPLLNLATEPVSAAELYEMLTHGGVFHNELAAAPAAYDMRTKYAPLFDGEGGYVCNKSEVLDAVRAFVSAARKSEGTI